MTQGNIIGYDINEKTCQISYYNEQQLEPETLEADTENYQIPLLIGKLRDTWAYGKEAKRLVSVKDGFAVGRLLSRSLAGEKIQFGEESYDAVWLLAKFVGLTLEDFEDIRFITFSTPYTNIDMSKMLKGIGRHLGVDKENIYVQDYKEGFCHYISQKSCGSMNQRCFSAMDRRSERICSGG